MDGEYRQRTDSKDSNGDKDDIEEQQKEKIEKTHYELQAPCAAGPSAPSFNEEEEAENFTSVPLDGISYGPSTSGAQAAHIAVCPTAPHSIEGFEHNKASIAVCPAAPYVNEGFVPDEGDFRNLKEPTAPDEEEPEELIRAREIATSFPPLNEDDVRAACQNYADDHCCYGSRFVRQMKVADIAHGIVFDYMLNSFGEKRETTMDYTPYKGGHVDGPECGTAPEPWSMSAYPSKYFQKDKRRMEIPHTSEVKECHKCDGTGQTTCWSCSGSGRTSCSSCSGSGKDSEDQTCSSCGGGGDERCSSCSGSGKVTCSKCDGYGKLRWYRVLIVTWEPHQEHFVSDTERLPRELILKAIGKFVYTEEERQLLPICNAPDASVNIASTAMINRHKTAFRNELIIKQRQTLRAIPLTRVTCLWKDYSGEFYVYGTENSVYFEDYPQKCCCCVIL